MGPLLLIPRAWAGHPSIHAGHVTPCSIEQQPSLLIALSSWLHLPRCLPSTALPLPGCPTTMNHLPPPAPPPPSLPPPAPQKTAPDVAQYDRGIAALKAEVFKARREAEALSTTLEDPKLTPDRWVWAFCVKFNF